MATIQELRTALEQCLELNKKFFAPNANSTKIVDKILENIDPKVISQLDPKELINWQKSPTMRKILMHSMVAANEMILSPTLFDPKFAKDPNLVLKIELLFKLVLTPAEQKKLEKLLERTNSKIRTEDKLEMPELLTYKTKEIEKFLKMHGKHIKHDPEENHVQSYNKALLGVDPTTTGGVQFTVFADVGDQTGIADLNNEFESDALSRATHTDHFNPSPFKTKPTPPGADAGG